ncbi:hypothetical protein LP417_35515 (plasmid) [Polaromonas sp. P1-6]|nr:hypothetical protein LP417_35515 [Polaromonas sp. P1-6]
MTRVRVSYTVEGNVGDVVGPAPLLFNGQGGKNGLQVELRHAPRCRGDGRKLVSHEGLKKMVEAFLFLGASWIEEEGWLRGAKADRRGGQVSTFEHLYELGVPGGVANRPAQRDAGATGILQLDEDLGCSDFHALFAVGEEFLDRVG